MATLDVEKCMESLSREDKIALLSGSDMWHTQAVPSLNVPRLRVSDGPNGIRGTRFFAGIASNCFPCGTGLAASWDEELLYEIGQQYGRECAVKGVHIWLGPTLNVQRSPLGGRGFESFSEDPLLSGKMSASIIRGVQSQGVSAFPKHFVCNEQELDRFSNSSELSERALREIYLKAFQICIREGEPFGLMTSYNRVNGIHVSEHPQILKEVLRDEWRFKGVLMTDWYGLYSTSEAIKATVDLEMPGPTVWRGKAVAKALAAGKLEDQEVDACVRRMLSLIKRGQESLIPFEKQEEGINDAASQLLGLKAARDAIVLLKNSGRMLPLPGHSRKIKKLAVIGPNAKIPSISGGGSASLKPFYVVSPLEAIKKLAHEVDVEVSYAAGCHASKYLPLIDPYLSGTEATAGLIHLSFYSADPATGSQAVHRKTVDTSLAFMLDNIPFDIAPRKCWMIAEATIIPDETGKWDFGLIVAGQGELYIDERLVVSNMVDQRPGDLFFGSGTAEEVGSVYMQEGHSYRLRMKWSNFEPVNPKVAFATFGGWRIGARVSVNATDLMSSALKTAADADAVVIIAGLNADVEGEGFDRKDMKQLDGVDDLITQVLSTNPNTCVVVQSGMPTEMPWASEAPAVVQAFYGGNEAGSAIADILFGKHNPSGKLPLTFPLRLSDVPSHPFFPGRGGYSYYNEDVLVGYRGMLVRQCSPFRCFGYGLSYTTFSVTDVKLDKVALDPAHQTVDVDVSAVITNAGHLLGAEVLQVYVSPGDACHLPRSPKELAGFRKINLKPGEAAVARISIDRSAFSYWDPSRRHNGGKGAWCVDPSTYTIFVGTSLEDVSYQASVVISEGFTWKSL